MHVKQITEFTGIDFLLLYLFVMQWHQSLSLMDSCLLSVPFFSCKEASEEGINFQNLLIAGNGKKIRICSENTGCVEPISQDAL